jgi:hypothetical protein
MANLPTAAATHLSPAHAAQALMRLRSCSHNCWLLPPPSKVGVPHHEAMLHTVTFNHALYTPSHPEPTNTHYPPARLTLSIVSSVAPNRFTSPWRMRSVACASTRP